MIIDCKATEATDITYILSIA